MFGATEGGAMILRTRAAIAINGDAMHVRRNPDPIFLVRIPRFGMLHEPAG